MDTLPGKQLRARSISLGRTGGADSDQLTKLAMALQKAQSRARASEEQLETYRRTIQDSLHAVVSR